MNQILINTISKAVKKMLQAKGGTVVLSFPDLAKWVNENCPGFYIDFSVVDEVEVGIKDDS